MKLVEIEDLRSGQIRENEYFYPLIDQVAYSHEKDSNPTLGYSCYGSCDDDDDGECDHTVKIFNKETMERVSLQDMEEFLIKNKGLSEDEAYWAKYDLINAHGKKIVGFLNITHKLENNKLIEIPREEYEADDVVDFLNGIEHNIFVLTSICEKEYHFLSIYATFLKCCRLNHFIKCHTRRDYPAPKPKKLGILGVNYEFVNDRLQKDFIIKNNIGE
ncbi:MAG: hypothetical protein LBG48_00910 [Rickettsiales bacterium]|jgi:hypothetical protein|nr:hypothetical protein [Rickettsiales bacterium]